MNIVDPLKEIGQEVSSSIQTASSSRLLTNRLQKIALEAFTQCDWTKVEELVSGNDLEDRIWKGLNFGLGQEIETIHHYINITTKRVDGPTLPDAFLNYRSIVEELRETLLEGNINESTIFSISSLLQALNIKHLMVRVLIIEGFRIRYQFGCKDNNQWSILPSMQLGTEENKGITNDSMDKFIEMTFEHFIIFKEAGKLKRSKPKSIVSETANTILSGLLRLDLVEDKLLIWQREKRKTSPNQGSMFDVGGYNSVRNARPNEPNKYEIDHIPSKNEVQKLKGCSKNEAQTGLAICLPKKLHKIGTTNGLIETNPNLIQEGWASCQLDAVRFYLAALSDFNELTKSVGYVDLYALGAFRYLARKNKKRFEPQNNVMSTAEAELIALFNHYLKESIKHIRFEDIF